jgi:hypothetical protein
MAQAMGAFGKGFFKLPMSPSNRIVDQFQAPLHVETMELGQFLKQYLRSYQIWCTETFFKPAVDLAQKLECI